MGDVPLLPGERVLRRMRSKAWPYVAIGGLVVSITLFIVFSRGPSWLLWTLPVNVGLVATIAWRHLGTTWVLTDRRVLKTRGERTLSAHDLAEVPVARLQYMSGGNFLLSPTLLLCRADGGAVLAIPFARNARETVRIYHEAVSARR